MPEMISVPVSGELLGTLVDRFPRVHLGQFPTPLDEVPRFSEAVGGPKILIKREDLTGLAFGGNKVRHLEYMFGSAMERGIDVVVTGSAAQSNFCRQTTAACAKLGLDIHLVLRKVRGDRDEVREGNLLLDELMGAKVTLVGPDEGERQAQMKADLVERLRQEGRNPYVPYQADGHIAAISYVGCFLELLGQLEERSLKVSRIYVCSATFTQAGLFLGSKATGAGIEVRGYPAFPYGTTAGSRVASLANEAARALGLNLCATAEEVYNSSEYVGRGYGMPTEKGIAALKLLARTEGIFLDPVYTSKGMAALIDHARSGELSREEPVVFVHTGGNPAVFAYADALTG